LFDRSWARKGKGPGDVSGGERVSFGKKKSQRGGEAPRDSGPSRSTQKVEVLLVVDRKRIQK